MSETNVPGIASELILRVDKWVGPLQRALTDSKTLGKELDTNLANSSASAGKALDQTSTDVHEMAKAVGAAVKDVHALSQANASIKPPALPAPTNVMNWGAGLRSLAGIAGSVNPALGQMVSGFTAVEGAAAAAGIGLTAALGPIAAVVAALATAKAAFDFGVGGVKLAADMQQTELAFEVMIGSADRAQATLAQLKRFASTTPFEFPEIAGAAKQLLAMGIAAEDLEGSLRMLGDVGSGLGQPLGEMAYLFGQIRSQGRAMTQDLNQFAGRGVPIYSELARVLKTNEVGVRELASEGKIGFAEINAAFVAMTSEGGKFFDMTSRQADTLNGRLSTLSDAWGEVQRQVGVAIIKNLDLDTSVKAITAAVETMAPVIVRAFNDATKSAAELWVQAEPYRAFLAETIELIGNLSGALKTLPIVNVAKDLGILIAPLTDVINFLKDAFKWVNDLIEAISYVTGDKIIKDMNANGKAWTAEDRAKGKPPADAPRTTPAAPSTPAPANGTSTAGSGTSSATPAPDKARVEREASLARARELEWENFIQSLRMQGLDEEADLKERHHRAESEWVKAKTDEERQQIQRRHTMDADQIKQRYAKQREEAARRDEEQKQRDEQKRQKADEPSSSEPAAEPVGPDMNALRDAARNERDPSKRTLAQLDLREALGNPLSEYNRGRQNRLRGGIETRPPRIGAAVAQRVSDLNSASEPGSSQARGTQGGQPQINVNAPEISVDKLARAISVMLEPVIDQRIAAVEKAAKLSRLTAQTRRGM